MLRHALKRHWALAWPLILANAATPFLGLADTAIAGHLSGAEHLAAVVVGAELVTLIFWSCGFLRMGTTGLIAQASGRDDDAAIWALLGNALTLAVGLGLLLILLWLGLGQTLIDVANPRPEVERLLVNYVQIRIWTAPIVLASYVLSAYFIGLGLTRVALGLALCVNLINVIANYTFAIGFNLDTTGIALGTVVSECVGVGIAATVILRRRGHQHLLSQLQIRWQTIQRLILLHIPLFFRTLILKAVFVMLTIKAAALSATDAAALGILLILLSTAAYTLDGFAFASEIETGQSVGAKDRARLDASLWAGLISTAVATLLIIIIYLLVAGSVVQMLTIHTTVSARALTGLPLLYLSLLVLAGSYWLDGVFIGFVQPMAMCVSMLIAGIAWVAGLTVIGSDSLSALLVAFILFGTARTLSLAIQLPSALRRSMQ